ncbi:MAG: glutaminase [Rhodospirillales bacterium]
MDLEAIINAVVSRARQSEDHGEVASYIPELAKVDPRHFAISVVLADGSCYSAGDTEQVFSIQSISKVFSLALALGRLGDSIWNRVGREPSGRSYDSIVQLEFEKGRPRNPFVNAGAIVVTDAILAGSTPREILGEILRFVRTAADDDDIHINKIVAKSEASVGYRNVALANYLRSFGNLNNDVELALGTYVHQCAIEMTCDQLARAGRFLVNMPDVPRLVSADRVRRINALMLTCGHYDGSGEFAFRVGLPGKSGVGGGILVIAPRRASIAVWSPGLDRYGNSLRGTKAIEQLVRHTGWSVFG